VELGYAIATAGSIRIAYEAIESDCCYMLGLSAW